MPEEIMQAIEQYIEAHPGTQINQERLKGMQENAKSLKDLQGKYTMKADINGERTCTVQFFGTAGNLYVTYTFNDIVVSE
jgi:hypothetical protein